MNKDFCPKCGKKELEFTSSCERKRRCNDCGYFIYEVEFQELKKKKKND